VFDANKQRERIGLKRIPFSFLEMQWEIHLARWLAFGSFSIFDSRSLDKDLLTFLHHPKDPLHKEIVSFITTTKKLQWFCSLKIKSILS